ncbi:hypothetical protein SB822_59155, partial [Paraburkholderia sp. SIMBA_054]
STKKRSGIADEEGHICISHPIQGYAACLANARLAIADCNVCSRASIKTNTKSRYSPTVSSLIG